MSICGGTTKACRDAEQVGDACFSRCLSVRLLRVFLRVESTVGGTGRGQESERVSGLCSRFLSLYWCEQVVHMHSISVGGDFFM